MNGKQRYSLLSFLLAALMLLLSFSGSAATPAAGHYWENEVFVARFDTVVNINRSITLARGFSVGMLDRAVKLKFWLSSPFIELQLPEDARFSLEEYRYMKIKYCARTVQKTMSVRFTAEGGGGTLTHKLTQDGWVEEIASVDLSGKVTKIRLTFGSVFKEEYDVVLLEYLAFFRTEAEAEAFGGMTEEQKNGTDPVSLYVKGEKETEALSDTSSSAVQTESSLTSEKEDESFDTGIFIGLVLGALVVISAVAVCLLIKRKKGRKPS